jgi:hypothetical protein
MAEVVTLDFLLNGGEQSGFFAWSSPGERKRGSKYTPRMLHLIFILTVPQARSLDTVATANAFTHSCCNSKNCPHSLFFLDLEVGGQKGLRRESRKSFAVNTGFLLFGWSDSIPFGRIIAETRFSFSDKDVHRVLAHDSLIRRKTHPVKIHPGKQVLSFSEQDGRKSQVHFVNQSRREILANYRDPTTNADFFALSGFFGFL